MVPWPQRADFPRKLEGKTVNRLVLEGGGVHSCLRAAKTNSYKLNIYSVTVLGPEV